MVLDLVIKKELDGYYGIIPSIKGWEVWAKNENEVIDKILDLSDFYLQIPKEKILIDKARKEDDKTIYKIVFNKD
jgi:hypothetical protein